MSGQIIGGCIIPGLPHLLQSEKSPQWQTLTKALENLKTHMHALKPDVWIIYSSQWLSVLGTSFQAHPNPKGLHVDENWHDLGDIAFDFPVDVELSQAFAKAVQEKGYPTKTVNFENFPIDTGTLVAKKFLDPDNKLPVVIVSSWAYADQTKSAQIGQTMRDAIEASNKSAFVTASSLMSNRFHSKPIEFSEDYFPVADDDEFNQSVLSAFSKGDFSKLSLIYDSVKSRVPVDMQLNAFHWLGGILEKQALAPEILGYSPLWGTGAAVVDFNIQPTQ